jgi:hypothetical protein
MIDWPWHTTWEEFGGGSKAHIYGMFPGYFLSSYVLGVRPDGPVANKRILIEPRLGDLTYAKGVVVTEEGPVPVSWRMSAGQLDFTFKVPEGVSASLRLPGYDGKARLVVDDAPAKGAGSGAISVELGPGAHAGTLAIPGNAGSFGAPAR